MGYTDSLHPINLNGGRKSTGRKLVWRPAIRNRKQHVFLLMDSGPLLRKRISIFLSARRTA